MARQKLKTKPGDIIFYWSHDFEDGYVAIVLHDFMYYVHTEEHRLNKIWSHPNTWEFGEDEKIEVI